MDVVSAVCCKDSLLIVVKIKEFDFISVCDFIHF